METNGTLQLYPFLRIAGLFLGGILLAAHFSSVPSYGWLLAAAVALVFSILQKKNPIASTTFLFACILMMGGWRMAVHNEHFVLPQEDYYEYDAVVTSQPVQHGKVLMCDLIVTSFQKPVKVSASIFNDENSRKLEVGSGIHALSFFEHPRNFEDAKYDYRSYLLHHGYVATTFLYSGEWTPARFSLKCLSMVQRARLTLLRYRASIIRRLAGSGMDMRHLAFVAAMSLGDKTLLDKETRTLFSITGTSHVLALSGLHFGIIYSLLMLLPFCRRHYFWGTVFVLMALWLFAMLAGLSSSIVRAAIMFSIYSVAQMSRRNTQGLNSLALAAFIMLAVSPNNIYDVGFQMSFAAVFFIVLFHQPFTANPRFRKKFYDSPSNRWPWAARWVWKTLTVSLSAQLGVAPLLAYHFHYLSAHFIIANFIVIPATAFIISMSIPLILCCKIEPVFMVLKDMLAFVVSLLESALRWIGEMPFPVFDNVHINAIQTMALYTAILSLSLLFINFSRDGLHS